MMKERGIFFFSLFVLLTQILVTSAYSGIDLYSAESICECSVVENVMKASCKTTSDFFEFNLFYQCQCGHLTVDCTPTGTTSTSSLITFNCEDVVNEDFADTAKCEDIYNSGTVACHNTPGYENRYEGKVWTKVYRTGEVKECSVKHKRTQCISSEICSSDVVDCMVSDFSDWSTCSKPCGGGTRSMTRLITQEPQNGGLSCPPLVITENCNESPCPMDCVVGEWSKCNCSEPCGPGTCIRERPVLVEPVGAGAPCPSLISEESCNLGPCQFCNLSDWSGWSECSADCGNGTKTRHRVVLAEKGGGCEGIHLKEEAACNLGPCPINCEAKWSSWSACSAPCGTGTQNRTLIVFQEGKYGGTPCPEKRTFTQLCNTHPCPVDCVTSEWSSWSECLDVSGNLLKCGDGLQHRSKNVTIFPQNGGKECGDLVETKECKMVPCQPPCELTSWTEWSDCSAPCEGGVRTREREILKKNYDDAYCGDLVQMEACNNHPCPVDCVVSEWAIHSNCNRECGGGIITFQRHIIVNSMNGGKECPSDLFKAEECNKHECPIDCVVSGWNTVSECSVSCGGGLSKHKRTILVAPDYGGLECPPLEEQFECNTEPCPLPEDCKMTPWTEWTECDKDCGGGMQQRSRSIISEPKHGGAECGETNEQQQCNTHNCPVNCIVGDWKESTDCSKSCGGGIKYFHREVLQAPLFNGTECPPVVRTETCNADIICPVDCKVSNWTQWTQCSQPCGEGSKFRERSVIVSQQGAGKECPKLLDVEPCNRHPCPVNCTLSSWSSWSSCSASCGMGYKTRSRKVLSDQMHGGVCPSVYEEAPCDLPECSVDCEVGEWGSWSPCSEKCGGGKRTRERKILKFPSGGGKTCPTLLETVECNKIDCPQDCVVSEWSKWSDCSEKCGTGLTTRTRVVKSEGKNGGKPCPNLSEQKECNLHPCDISALGSNSSSSFCSFSEWKAPTECSKPCGGGVRERVRDIKIMQRTNSVSSNANDTIVCGPSKQISECNTQPCLQDCELSAWSSWSTCSEACGVGFKMRSRTVSTPSLNGGRECGPLVEFTDCIVKPCPMDCRVSSWGKWSVCSSYSGCGEGRQSRNRTVIQKDTFGGNACPELEESRTCTIRDCPSECTYSGWKEKSPECSHVCGGGLKSWTRTVELSTPNASASICTGLLEIHEPCNSQPCPINCSLSDWSAFSGCSQSCGGGFSKSIRKTVAPNSGGGVECETLMQEKDCGMDACPSSPVVPIPNPYPLPSSSCPTTEWSSWGPCEAKCPCKCSGSNKVQFVRKRTRRFVGSSEAQNDPNCPLVEEIDCDAVKAGSSITDTNRILTKVTKSATEKGCDCNCNERDEQKKELYVEPELKGPVCKDFDKEECKDKIKFVDNFDELETTKSKIWTPPSKVNVDSTAVKYGAVVTAEID